MNSVLVFTGPKEFCDILVLNLRSYLDVSPDVATDINMAKEFMSEKNYDLIIASSETESSKPIVEIADFLTSSGSLSPLVSLGDDPKEELEYDSTLLYSIDQIDDIKSILKVSADIIGVTPKDLAKAPVSKYFPIPIDHFHSLDESPADVYIKIGRGEKTQFLKRIHKGEGLEEEAVNRYVDGGVKNLFVRSLDRLHFVNTLTQQIIKIFNKEPTNSNEVLKAAEIAQDIVAQNIDVLGITPEIIQMSDKAIEKMAEEAEKHPLLGKLLERLTNNKASFSFKHTQLTTYMCMTILRKIDWGKKEQYRTLSFVAFFHDIVLPNDKMAMIRSEEELKNSGLGEREKEYVMKHAQKSAELIHKYPHMPMGADALIRQHHGVLNGMGFSETFSGNLSPLAVVFIVAEECAHIVLKSEDEKLNKRKILFELEQKFKTSRFQKMLQALEEVL